MYIDEEPGHMLTTHTTQQLVSYNQHYSSRARLSVLRAANFQIFCLLH